MIRNMLGRHIWTFIYWRKRRKRILCKKTPKKTYAELYYFSAFFWSEDRSDSLFQNALVERRFSTNRIPRPNNIQRQFSYNIPYDPNGPSRSRLRTILALDDLSKVLSETENAKITICYQKPNNLGNKLMRTKTTADPPLDLAALENIQDAVQDSGAK